MLLQKPLMIVGILMLVLFLVIVQQDNSTTWETQDSVILEIRCSNPEGCHHLLERAIAEAPAGATVRIQQGLYYERTVVIDKPITLEGVRKPEIRFTDPGVGFDIRLGQGQDESMTVVLQDLRISVPREPRAGPDEYVGVVIEGNPDLLSVVLRDSEVEGGMGLVVIGARFFMERTLVDATVGAVDGRYSRLNIADSILKVDAFDESDPWKYGLPPISIGFQSSNILLLRNRIEGGFYGVLLGIDDNAQLIQNTITGAMIGAYITDNAVVDLRENRFLDNKKYGIAVSLSDCVPRPSGFRGTIDGSHNEFQGNGQDLCPLDYPWPENFKKSP
jgi:hypothetical protein